MKKPEPKPTIAVRMADAVDELHKLKAEADKRKVSYTLTDKPDDRPEPLAMGYCRVMGNIDILKTALALVGPEKTPPAAKTTAPTGTPKPTAPKAMTYEQASAAYSRISDPKERKAFREAHAVELRLKNAYATTK